MSGAKQRRTARPDAPILDAGLDPHGTDHPGTLADEPHTEFAVGLQRTADGRTTLRRHQNTPPTLPEFAPMALSEAEMALRQPMVARSQVSQVPRRATSGRSKPPPLPPPTPAPTDEIVAAVSGQDDQAGVAVVSLTATPPPPELRPPASAPLDPAAFASPQMMVPVDRLIDQVIDEVDALTPSQTVAAGSSTNGPGGAEQPGAAILMGPRTPAPSFGPRERGTEMVDGQAVAIDRAVSRAVQTGISARPAEAPGGWGDDSSLKVVLGRPALASVAATVPGLDAVASSGLELAYEPRAPGVRRSPRTDRRFAGASAAHEASIVRPLLMVAGVVICALILVSILRSFDLGF